MDRRAIHLSICAALACASLGLYWQTTGFGFVNFDDYGYVVENPNLALGLSPEALGWTLRPYHGNWIPLTWLSFAADYAIGGLDPAVYHRTNALLHAAAGVLLYVALAALSQAPWRSAFVAFVFALHPLHVESVAWIAERKDVLSGFFFALCLLAYVHYARRPFSLLRYAVVATTLALGLLAKASVVTLPCVLLLLDYWPLGRLRTEPRRALLEKLPLLGLSGFATAMAVLAARGSDALEVRFVHRLANAALAYAGYLRRALWPTDLAIFYPHPAAEVSVPLACLSALGLAAATLAALRIARTHPFITVGWLWFLGMLVPMIGIVQAGQQALADRFMYLPLIGLAIAVGWAVPDRFGTSGVGRAAIGTAGVCVLLGLAVMAYPQVGVFRNSSTVFGHALAVTRDNAVAHHMLAVELLRDGRPRDAIPHFAAAEALDPEWATPALFHGKALASTSDYAGARKQYAIALRIEPGWSQAILELASVHVASNEPGKAIRLLDRVLEQAEGGERARALALLGRAEVVGGRLEAASAAYREALQLQPAAGDVHAELGLVLLESGQPTPAREELLRAEELGHRNVDAHLTLASLLLAQGSQAKDGLAKGSEATNSEAEGIEVLERLIAANPSLVAAQNNLAWHLATTRAAGLRNPTEALRLARSAAELTNRRDPEVLDTLAAALAANGEFTAATRVVDEAIALARENPEQVARLRRAKASYRQRAR